MLAPDLLEEGLLLFNNGQFYEAHEVWEDLWRSIEDPLRKACCQGLIQAAVGLHHLGRGNTVGARSQIQKSIRNLQRGSGKLSELNIAGLVGQLASVLDDMPDRVPPVVIARLK